MTTVKVDDLLVNVLAVEMAACQHNADEERLHADGDGLQLPRLQLAAVVAVKGEGPQPLPGYAVSNLHADMQLHLTCNLFRAHT